MSLRILPVALLVLVAVGSVIAAAAPAAVASDALALQGFSSTGSAMPDFSQCLGDMEALSDMDKISDPRAMWTKSGASAQCLAAWSSIPTSIAANIDSDFSGACTMKPSATCPTDDSFDMSKLMGGSTDCTMTLECTQSLLLNLNAQIKTLNWHLVAANLDFSFDIAITINGQTVRPAMSTHMRNLYMPVPDACTNNDIHLMTSSLQAQYAAVSTKIVTAMNCFTDMLRQFPEIASQMNIQIHHVGIALSLTVYPSLNAATLAPDTSMAIKGEAVATSAASARVAVFHPMLLLLLAALAVAAAAFGMK